jgi:hypothetical protein
MPFGWLRMKKTRLQFFDPAGASRVLERNYGMTDSKSLRASPGRSETVHLAEASITADSHACAGCNTVVKAAHYDHDPVENLITADCPNCGRRVFRAEWR